MHEGDHNILGDEHDHQHPHGPHDHHHSHDAAAGQTRQARSRIIAGIAVGAAVVIFLLWRLM